MPGDPRADICECGRFRREHAKRTEACPKESGTFKLYHLNQNGALNMGSPRDSGVRRSRRSKTGKGSNHADKR